MQRDSNISAPVLILTNVSYLSTFHQDPHSFFNRSLTLSFSNIYLSLNNSSFFKPLPSYVQLTALPRILLLHRQSGLFSGFHNISCTLPNRNTFVYSKQGMLSPSHRAFSSIFFLISNCITKADHSNPTSNVFHSLSLSLFGAAEYLL